MIAATFHELLAAAYSFGASLLKFGGDALLLFFTGDQHALRSCAAARAMQQRLDEVGVCATSAGKVTLRMSVGIHSGMFDFFLVGGSHRELIVSGPAATRTVEMEGAARAGQVLLSPGTASAIPAANRGRPSGPGVLLRGGMDVESAARRHVESSPDELAQFVPVGLCQLLLSGEVEPEHRPATVAFLQFHGLDGRHRARRCRGCRRTAGFLDPGCPGGCRRPCHHVPGDRHRNQRRQDHPHRRCSLDYRQGRRGDVARTAAGDLGRTRPSRSRSESPGVGYSPARSARPIAVLTP